MGLLQPSCDAELIKTRLDCVEELIRDKEVLYGLEVLFNCYLLQFNQYLLYFIL